VVEGENVLHHVKGAGNCPELEMSGDVCTGDMSRGMFGSLSTNRFAVRVR